MEKWLSLSRKNFDFSFYQYKKKLIKENGLICEKCKKQISRIENSTLDHIIPVKVGGPNYIWDKNNLWLLCRECNSKKLSIDKRIIYEMTRKRFFSVGTNWHILFKPISECVKYYKNKFIVLKKEQMLEEKKKEEELFKYKIYR